MSYRVETASSGRSICRAAECKDAGIKIPLGDLRLGVWVPYQDQGSWHWKHWGCVTGAQLLNMRNYLGNPDGTYKWDALDGYEGDEKNSLDHHPDLQEKVRDAITNGFIDPDDFNGDPEMNKLGEKGLRTKESKKKLMEAAKNRDHVVDELEQQNAALKAEVLRLRASGASASKQEAAILKLEDQMEGISTSSKKKAAAKKRVRAEDNDEEDVKPAKKSRAKKAVKKEESESDLEDLDENFKKEVKRETKPAKKSRAKKSTKKEESEDIEAKLEDDDDEVEEKPKPARKSRAKKGVKKEEELSEDEAEVMPAPSKRSQSKRGVKEEVIKDEQDDELSLPAPPKKTARGKKGVKKEEDNDEPAVKKEPAKRGSRKKAVAKEEPLDDAGNRVKGEPREGVDAMADVPDIKDEPLKNEGVKDEDLKGEDVKDESVKNDIFKSGNTDTTIMKDKDDEEESDIDNEKPSVRISTGGRATKKQKSAPTPSNSTRATRSRKAKN